MFWDNITKTAIFFTFLFVLVLFLRNKRREGTFSLPLLFGALLALSTFIYLAFHPVENLFYTFPTVESIGDYVFPNSSLCIVEGRESALIFKEGTDEFAPVLRVEQGYQLQRNGVTVVGSGYDGNRIDEGHRDWYTFFVFSVAGDHYVQVYGMWGTLEHGTPLEYLIARDADIIFSDNLGSEFKTYRDDVSSDSESFPAVAYVEGLDGNYVLVIKDLASGAEVTVHYYGH